jgi:RHS repeat-associated protein
MDDRQSQGQDPSSFFTKAPVPSLPTGGGAIRSIGEKFSVNAVTGTAGFSVPIAASPGRGGFGPQLALSYDSGSGNGLFGLGWSLGLPSVRRKTEKGLPVYDDAEESDVFVLAGTEDLVPLLAQDGRRAPAAACTVYGRRYLIRTYRPRVEGGFALVERWADEENPANVFWRTLTRDNVTTWYGKSSDSRIVDPENATRIFEWSICEVHDDRGNVALYEYVRDDANIHVRSIRYGNLKPYLPTLVPQGTTWPAPDDVPGQEWMFEVGFELGPRLDPFSSHRSGFEIRTSRTCRSIRMLHHFANVAEVGNDCLVRSTEFDYDEPADLADPDVAGYTVLRSVTHRSYERREPPDTGYESRDMPPVTFSYRQPHVDRDVRVIASEALENLPAGIAGNGYQFIDLDGEGLSGVLARHANGWYYTAGVGDGRFAPARLVAEVPSVATGPAATAQLLDLDGDGAIDVVEFGRGPAGFHERDRERGWTGFVPFESLPNVDWAATNLRFIDLTGDGVADALVTEDDVFIWYPSLEERGFDRDRRARPAEDEERGPHLVFADGVESIFTADMSGDGLADLVRIRQREISYWPNLGYGRFGRKVTLANSPTFDNDDLFDPRRIRLADIDGSGPADVVYLGRDGARLYFNRSGNSLSDGLPVELPAATEDIDAVQVADLLGNGTACLVWSSSLPADVPRPVRYVDLMSGKPHLLTDIDNGLGGKTTIEYKPSTYFYLRDRAEGRPWATRLPFPVHCVSRTIVSDPWRGTTFSSTYSYHHGYFDGGEREFRGFARVEQVDAERFGELAQPPVKTITWYYTGAALDRSRILTQLAGEYFPAGFRVTNGFFEKPLAEPELPAALTAGEWREALRACRGMPLRRETYELDVTALTGSPSRQVAVRLFSTSIHHCRIDIVQRKGANRHAVFLANESETLTYHYELTLPSAGGDIAPDPRIAHALKLRFDLYGNVTQSLAVAYPRYSTGLPNGLPASLPRQDLIAQVQAERHAVYTETRYATSDAIVRAPPFGGQPGAVRHRRLRLPCEVRTYELSGLAPSGRYFDIDELRRYQLCEDTTYPAVVPEGETAQALGHLEYHEQPRNPGPHRRVVERVRTRYFRDEDGVASPSAPHPFGSHGPRGLKYEDYKLALTDALLAAVFQRRDDGGQPIGVPLLDLEVESGTTGREVLDERVSPAAEFLRSGYIHGVDIDPSSSGQYWIRSGRAGFAAAADVHFYLPEHYIDAFGSQTTLTYDGRDMFVESAVDARGNATRVSRFDYRVLAPIEMVDPNGNYTEVAHDIRGLVVAGAVKGKPVAAGWEGDDLRNFDLALRNPPESDVQTFCTSATLDVARAEAWLDRSSSRFVYHFGNSAGWGTEMAAACAVVRERRQPAVDRDPLHENPLQVSLQCSDAAGNVLMNKVQAEPAAPGGPLRWLVNGLTVVNNKGNPVKQYEPAFSASFGIEPPQANGVASVMHYDAPGRVVRTEFPDGTFGRVEFSPWHVRTFDRNDTVLDSAWYARRIASTDVDEREAARRAARHANTPAIALLDSQGRETVAIAQNSEPEYGALWTNTPLLDRLWRSSFAVTFTKLDAEGKPLWIRDALGNLVVQYILQRKGEGEAGEALPSGAAPCYDLAGNLLFAHSMDSGDKWTLADAAGEPLLSWDFNTVKDASGATVEERRIFRARADTLRRPVERWLRIDSGEPVLVDAFEYLDTVGLSPAALQSARRTNRIGQAIRHFDSSGLATVERVGFDGNVEEVTRHLVSQVNSPTVDWSVTDRGALLEAGGPFRQITEYDALGRMTTSYNWHRDDPSEPGRSSRVAVNVPKYNRRGLLESETVHLRAAKVTGADGRPSFVEHADPSRNVLAIERVTWNEKGQKGSIALGNGTETRYVYDRETFRLRELVTTTGGRTLQGLRYLYDPSGNVTRVADSAQHTIWFDNQQVDAASDFIYDALYRLIEGTGRETAWPNVTLPRPEGNWPVKAVPSDDMTRRYTERYRYDLAGNIEEMDHGAGPASWTRYCEVTAGSNRLRRTWHGDRSWNASAANTKVEYRHDLHGNLQNVDATAPGRDARWDWRDMIRALDLVGGGWAYYSYDNSKQRTRKRIVRNSGETEDRIYLPDYELYRRRSAAGTVVEEIESVHVFAGGHRVLLVDDVLIARGSAQPGPNGLRVREQTLFRYQYGNHLGSVSTELDEQARVISHEEYHPYGTPAYRVVNSLQQAPARRYRFTGMERDEESGLSYHGARYYAAWLGRWCAPDPAPPAPATNRWTYVSGKPTRLVDTDGATEEDAEQKAARMLAKYGRRPTTGWEGIVPSNRPLDYAFRPGSKQLKTLSSAEPLGKAATAVTYLSLGAFAVIEAAPLLIAAGRTVLASAWESTVGPLVQGARTAFSLRGAGFWPALMAAAPALTRFVNNVISFANPDPTNVLATEAASISQGVDELSEFAIKQYGQRKIPTTVAQLSNKAAAPIGSRAAELAKAFEGRFAQNKHLGNLWMEASSNARTFDEARETFWKLVRTSDSEAAVFVREMVEQAGFVFRKGSAETTAPVLREHISRFSEAAARNWAGSDPMKQQIVARLLEARAGGKVPASDFSDRLLSIDHDFARARGGPEFNPFYLRFMIMRDNSIKGDRL